VEHVCETNPVADCVHDLVQVFNTRLNSVWHYDQYIANAEGNRDLQDFWRTTKKQDQQACDKIRQLLAKQLQN
jgi:hypothetical protein